MKCGCNVPSIEGQVRKFMMIFSSVGLQLAVTLVEEKLSLNLQFMHPGQLLLVPCISTILTAGAETGVDFKY